MSDQVHDLGDGVSVVLHEDGKVSIIGPASNGDIECLEIPRRVVAKLSGTLFAADVSYAMRGWDQAMAEMGRRLAELGRLRPISVRDEQDTS